VEFPKDLRNNIIKNLRRIGYLNIHYRTTAESAHVERGKWQCNECKQRFKRKEIHMDHIDPVVPTETGFTDWNDYLTRLFMGKLQALCIECHQRKSSLENEARRKKRNAKKD
jgi:hypothetical protein